MELTLIGKIVIFKKHTGIRKHVGRCVSYTCDDFGKPVSLNVEVDGLFLTRTFQVYPYQIISIT